MSEKKIKELLDGRKPKVIGLTREYAVMILLAVADGKLSFVFEKRSGSIKQPGDVCFPGGKVEPGETVVECALRETAEEINITDVEVLGRYDSQYELSGIGLHSVVGLVSFDNLKKALPNKTEVEKIIIVPVEFFQKNEPMIYDYDILQDVSDFPYEEVGIRADYKWRKGHQQIPIYKFEEEVIWGLTGTFVKRLAEEMRDYGDI